jgi:hypothetical protein
MSVLVPSRSHPRRSPSPPGAKTAIACRGGDRQLNRALHVMAITRARIDPQTREYLERKHRLCPPPYLRRRAHLRPLWLEAVAIFA